MRKSPRKSPSKSKTAAKKSPSSKYEQKLANATDAINERRNIGESKNGIEIWHESYDDEGYCFYYNEKTQESKWEPPEWIEEIDTVSGLPYYIQYSRDEVLCSLDEQVSTWERPSKYCRLLRHSDA